MMRKKRTIASAMAVTLLLSLFGTGGGVFAQEPGADAVFLNGNIYTVDDSFSKAGIIATKGQKIVYIGSDDREVQAFIDDGATVYDLEGRTVIPGLIDSHIHFLRGGLLLMRPDIFEKQKADIQKAVADAVKNLAPGEWVVSQGWNHELWPDKQFPNKAELDAVAPDNPVVLTRVDGHSLWANSAAMRAAGIDADGKTTPNPDGGTIDRDANGEATGTFRANAMALINGAVPPTSAEQNARAILAAQGHMLSYGITSAMDAGETLDNIGLIKSLYESGDLKVRLYQELATATDEDIKFRAQTGGEAQIGLYGDRYTIRTAKGLIDGSLGSRTAFMLAPYEPYTNANGDVVTDTIGEFRIGDPFEDIFRRNLEAGFQVSLHAIGDAANRRFIDLYETLKAEGDFGDARPRIEHFQVVHPDDIKRAIELGIIPSMQFNHATSDMNMAESRVGAQRIQGAYAWRTILDLGGIIANGTDWPVELLNPYYNLYAGVTRLDRQTGTSPHGTGGWYPEQKVTREEALRAYTNWSAYAQFEEDLKGSLEVGKLADFVVIDRDYMTVPAEQIKDIQAVATVLGGEIVFGQLKQDSITVIVNGQKLAFDVAPQNINGRVLVPLRVIFEEMGAQIEWDDSTQTAVATKGDTVVTITVGDTMPAVNGNTVTLDQPALIAGGRTLAPLRFVAEAFGGTVAWSDNTQTATITTP